MPENDLTLKEFANNIRSKYPDSKLYKEKSDVDLAKAFIDSNSKYEVYRSRIKDWPTEFPIVPKDGESFADTMKRGAKAGQNIVPKKGETFLQTMGRVAGDGKDAETKQKMKEKYTPGGMAKDAGITLGSAATIGFAGPAILGGLGTLGRRLFLDQNIVTRDVMGRFKKEVIPSVVKAINNHIKQPGTLIKTPYGRAVEYYLISKVGVSKGTVAKLAEMIGEK